MKILNKLGLYSKSDLKQAFKNGVMSEQQKMYVFNQEDLVFKKPTGVSKVAKKKSRT